MKMAAMLEVYLLYYNSNSSLGFTQCASDPLEFMHLSMFSLSRGGGGGGVGGRITLGIRQF